MGRPLELDTNLPLGPFLVIAGPTAVGKSTVAMAVAEAIGGEIVIADSRQIYRGIDIASAKPAPADRARVPHHMLDRVGIGSRYSAADYARDARAAIVGIQSRGRTAIVCGGTGFYLAALAGGLDSFTVDTPDAARDQTRVRLAAIPAGERHAALAAVDPASAVKLHPNDHQRIARALEVHFATGRPLSELQSGGGERLAHCAIRLTRPAAELRARIEVRLEAMLAAGIENEARALWQARRSAREPGLDAIGIREWWPFFEGEAVRETVVRAILVATRSYAKRQATWFRNQGDYRPVPAVSGAAAVIAEWRSFH